jgi:hypothetical protein
MVGAPEAPRERCGLTYGGRWRSDKERPPGGGQFLEKLPVLAGLITLAVPARRAGATLTMSVVESGGSVLGLRSFPLRLQPELDQAGHFARSFLKSRNMGGPFKNLCLRTSGSSIGAFGSMCRSITLAASSAVRAAAFALGRSAGFTVSPISTKRADCCGKRWRRSVRKRNRQRLSAHARRLKR